ncbi:undecaprenyl-phosphate glucose phosphotransferase [Mucilaginibacter litoreus]|uniref:Undecaprenyl-phosphate glucose phosphotransferase n=1 Tax=Mucilaginibacter litoreus TaxID=1048221 RepID=A0ABW3AV93_9SPHI
MNHRYSTFVKTINLIVDYICLNVGMVAAYQIEGRESIFWMYNKNYLPVVLLFNLTWLLSANITGLYQHVLHKDSIKTFSHVIKTYLIFISLICVIIIVNSTNTYLITRDFLFSSSTFFGVLLAVWKLLFLILRRSDRARLNDSRSVIIVGCGRIGKDLQAFFQKYTNQGYKVAGFFDDDPDAVDNKEMYLGPVDDCIKYVLDNSINEIFCTLPVSESSKIEKLIVDADKNMIRFKFVPEYYNYGIKPVFVQSFGHIPVISVRAEPLENMLNRFIKRLFDIVFSLFIIIFFFSWLFPILAILIKLESRGPVFFKQLRSGRENEPFMCFKFRSMKVNNDSDKKQATRGDSRVTKIGAFMRRTSIDELPQFFNVLIGNMSVVGPRPHMLSHTEQYASLIDKYMLRHFLKPGITGWAQVNGLRGETPYTELMAKRIEYDVWYLENWSFLLDLKIIFLTVWNSAKGEENAF